MEIRKFFYKLYLVDNNMHPLSFIGSAFPITPNGGLLTCRHVVDQVLQKDNKIAVLEPISSKFIKIGKILVGSDSTIDIAYLPNVLGETKLEYFPLLTPEKLMIGEDVYSFGYFSFAGNTGKIEHGYFSGKIINFFTDEKWPNQQLFTTPYAILEGMSGSPVLTYHNGPKLVGIAIGNRSSRILTSEIIEYKEEKQEYKETINRIVEFGIAYHSSSIINFLQSVGVKNFKVSHERLEIPGLN